jgi:hypothetical protein
MVCTPYSARCISTMQLHSIPFSQQPQLRYVTSHHFSLLTQFATSTEGHTLQAFLPEPYHREGHEAMTYAMNNSSVFNHGTFKRWKFGNTTWGRAGDVTASPLVIFRKRQTIEVTIQGLLKDSFE